MRFTAPVLAAAALALVLQTLYKIAGVFIPWAAHMELQHVATQAIRFLSVWTLTYW